MLEFVFRACVALALVATVSGHSSADDGDTYKKPRIERRVEGLALSPKGDVIALRTDAGLVTVHLETGKETTVDRTCSATAITYGPDGTLWVADRGGNVGMVGCKTFRVYPTWDQYEAIYELAVSPNGKTLAVMHRAAVTLVDTKNATVIERLKRTPDITGREWWTTRFRPDGKVLLFGGGSTYDLTAKKTVRHGQVAAFDDEGTLVVCDSQRAGVGVRSNAVMTYGSKKVYDDGGHRGYAGGIVVHGKGKNAVIAWQQYTMAFVHHMKTGKTLELTVGMHNDYNWVTGLAILPDGKRLVIAQFDGSVKVWDATTGKPTKTLAHGMSEKAKK